MPSATPTTSSTTRRSRWPMETFGAKNGRGWCSRLLATSQDRPAASPAWTAKSRPARARRNRSATVARDRWLNSLIVSTVVSMRSRAVAMVNRLAGYLRRARISEHLRGFRAAGVEPVRRVPTEWRGHRHRQRLAVVVGRTVAVVVRRTVAAAHPQHHEHKDHHAAEQQGAAEEQRHP